MKIAMIHTPLVSRGGGQRQILKLAFELQKFGHEVEIFTSAVNKEKCYREIIEKLTVNVIPHPLGNRIPKFLVPSEIYQKDDGGGETCRIFFFASLDAKSDGTTILHNSIRAPVNDQYR